ncbi:NADAR family protein [Nocardiopsis exhalans]|uniref:NADAR family protein n=1 Tax=Nocardiopsis exhalans TaxID=163604 RepID=A0ABY5D4C5_9ACTN|nr:NADAR family protein [Nocardiopsis exhalans]USY17953.1 NADAR family protein [Nocardiopsis exhalans]
MPAPMFTGQLGFLSNFDTTSFFVSQLNTDVPSGEHAFNALKTLSDDERRHVLAAPTPAESKKRGRRVTLRPEWDAGVRVWAMQRVLMAKFSVPELSAKLQATGSLRLVETNRWHDQFWGDCFCDRHAQTPGQNMLGELIMAIRAHQRVS